jgi:Tfp pilus assembly protein PilN
LLAYLRAIHEQKVAGKSGCNVLVAMLRGTDSTCSPQAVLALCVLKNGAIDFIRTKDMAESSGGSDDLNCWLAEELSEVVIFYDSEVSENTGKWEITVFVDSTLRLDSGQASSPRVDAAQSPQAVEECIKSRIQAGRLQVRTIENAYTDTPVGGSAAGKDERPSPVAVGLAMKLLMAQSDDVKINLVPPQIVRAREAKRDALIAVNVIAAVLLIMVLAVRGFTLMAKKINRGIDAKKLVIAGQDTEIAVEQHRRFDAKLQVLSTRLDRLAQISASRRDVSWAELFDEIRKATPGSVRITSLSSQDGLRVLVSGLAMSNEAVNLFVNLLEKSQSIASVTLLETHEQEGQNITYQLSCKLAI